MDAVTSEDAGLGVQAVRGGAITVVTQVVRAVVQFAGLIILSRLLPPEDVGILAMVFIVTNLGDVIRDFGLSAAAIQVRHLSTEERSALFWINALLGLAAAALAIAIAPAVAALLEEPRLTAVLRVVSVTLLFNALGAQYQAHLNRGLRLSAIGWAEVGATLAALLAAVVGIHFGLGYWALAIQQLVLASALPLALAVMSGWLPGPPRSRTDVRRFISYGSPLFGNQLLVYVTQNADNFVVGRRFGASALGPYSRAFQLLTLPVNQLSAPLLRVTLPVLSRVQDDRSKFDDYLHRGQLVLGYTIVGLFGWVSAIANPLFVMLLGREWGGVATPFRILAVGGCFQSMTFVCYWVFLSKALTRSLLSYSLVSKAAGLILIIGGSHWGVNGVAAGVAVGLALNWPLSTWWLARRDAISATRLTVSGVRVLVAGLGPAAAGIWAGSLMEADLPRLAAATGGWAAGVALLVATPLYRADLRILLHAGALLRGPSVG